MLQVHTHIRMMERWTYLIFAKRVDLVPPGGYTTPLPVVGCSHRDSVMHVSIVPLAA